MNNELIEDLKNLWETLMAFLKVRDYKAVVDYIAIFLNTDVDINYYKTILIITKDFKQHPIIGPVRAQLYKKYYNYMIEKYPNFSMYNPHPDDNV